MAIARCDLLWRWCVVQSRAAAPKLTWHSRDTRSVRRALLGSRRWSHAELRERARLRRPPGSSACQRGLCLRPCCSFAVLRSLLQEPAGQPVAACAVSRLAGGDAGRAGAQPPGLALLVCTPRLRAARRSAQRRGGEAGAPHAGGGGRLLRCASDAAARLCLLVFPSCRGLPFTRHPLTRPPAPLQAHSPSRSDTSFCCRARRCACRA